MNADNTHLLLQLLIYHMDIEIAHADEIICEQQSRVFKCQNKLVRLDAMVDQDKQYTARLNRAYVFRTQCDEQTSRVLMRSEMEQRHTKRRDDESDRLIRLGHQVTRAEKDAAELRDAKGHLISLLASV